MESEQITKESRISLKLSNDLKTFEQKEKFLEILEKRMEENKKSLGSLFVALLLCGFAFQLILQTKISEVNLGPFTVNDTKIIFLIIPSIFTFVYYKYLMIWYDFAEQKNVYKVLTSLLFDLEYESYLNERLRPFSITDSVSKYHSQKKMNLTGCLGYFLWLPIGLIIIIFPFGYEVYLIFKLLTSTNSYSFFEILLIAIPSTIFVLTILMLVKVIDKGIKGEN
ncbi:MAG: hypothetical protein K0R77_646 [Chryseobacterium sp.]|jgi:hypothetical protein|uniref:hypothetical protein n=1 Tax=Chryseobacterium sp. TaxID=1871047 RepID=UPI002618A363|nr:hypothetical protein [Chryseobacterium sp.]MDF2551371.1 hypothetical protein [Chryseobacterium sp.]